GPAARRGDPRGARAHAELSARGAVRGPAHPCPGQAVAGIPVRQAPPPAVALPRVGSPWTPRTAHCAPAGSAGTTSPGSPTTAHLPLVLGLPVRLLPPRPRPSGLAAGPRWTVARARPGRTGAALRAGRGRLIGSRGRPGAGTSPPGRRCPLRVARAGPSESSRGSHAGAPV
ncbi:MAG: hypothetical protein AVDCRST_MAG60-1267, partial [uncultured Nocardioides sp.]